MRFRRTVLTAYIYWYTAIVFWKDIIFLWKFTNLNIFSALLDTLNWSAPAEGFGTITKLLPLKTYQYNIFLGLTISTGGLTESLVRTYFF